MGDFDNLPGVFYLAKVDRGQDRVMITYEEYKVYLAIWNALTEDEQMECLENAKKLVNF